MSSVYRNARIFVSRNRLTIKDPLLFSERIINNNYLYGKFTF